MNKTKYVCAYVANIVEPKSQVLNMVPLNKGTSHIDNVYNG